MNFSFHNENTILLTEMETASYLNNHTIIIYNRGSPPLHTASTKSSPTKELAINWFHWNVVMNANGAEGRGSSSTTDLAHFP